jgi:hypothetical protein
MFGQIAFGFEGEIAIFAGVGSEVRVGANMFFQH